MAMFAPILVETPQLLIIHKPAGVPFHGTSEQLGIISLLRQQRIDENPSRIDERLYAVHRLDAVTSGAMFFAKEPEVAKELMAAFRARKVSKYYVALSSRRPSKKEGSVKGDMRRGRRGGWMLERTQDNPAVTRFASAGVPAAAAPGLRAFLLKPDTGKTHQLRVALKSLGSPVLGDQRYANKGEAEGEERAYLHCAALRVVLGGKAVQVVSPPLEGAHFLGEGFRGVFDAWFPPEMRGDEGVWFGDSKLLRSRLDVAVPVGFGSLSQGSMF